MKKIFTLILAVACAVIASAEIISFVQIDDLFYNLDTENQTAEVTSQNSSVPYWSINITTANIPETVTYNDVIYAVTSVSERAFYSCINLTEISIPNSVTNIGKYAFYKCMSLRSITLPNSMTVIKEKTFSECSGLLSVSVPNSVTTIENRAFHHCSSLPSIQIPNSVTNFGSDIFMECTQLSTPVYNDHFFIYLYYYYPGAFTIPDGIKEIVSSAFYQCMGMSEVTIPSSVEKIGNRAFYYCSRLKTVNVYGKTPAYMTSDDEVFGRCPDDMQINVRDCVEAEYKAAEGWSDYADKIVGSLSCNEDVVEIEANDDNSVSTPKILRNGQLLIERDGKIYTVTGQEVR